MEENKTQEEKVEVEGKGEGKKKVEKHSFKKVAQEVVGDVVNMLSKRN